ncbi:MAG: 3-hydroxyacyl-CoA dehydrogenase NAD-binding domain-containing protein, partial [Cognatishimia sp.]|nr:3-hydroxyacyl-CoA dehydrogenase NAD-binding domain-containing protein [Cognatishimia sp.]
MSVTSVGIIGAGQMGNGIAHVMALAGYDVVLNDISAEALEAAIARIDKNMARQVSRDLITADDMQNALRRIKSSQDVVEVGQTDLVIEAATENEEIKYKI